MSQQNVEIVRTYFEAFGSGELDLALQYLDPQIQWRNWGLIDDEAIEGRDAVRMYWERILSTFPFVLEDHSFSANGDRVCVTATLRATGVASGVELAGSCSHAITLRDRIIVRSDFFAKPDEAL